MFGREKTPATAAREQEPQVEVKPGGKGRPTPSRREAEQRNRTPLIGAQPAKGATREEKKALRTERTAKNREERVRMRQAMASGDERYLPARDKGPARRWARDHVDARRNVGEFAVFFLLAAVVLQLVPSAPAKLAGLLVMYGFVLATIVDSFLLRRTVLRRTTEKFGAEAAKGVGGYAIMRAIQLRRGRMPAPRVNRGEFPG